MNDTRVPPPAPRRRASASRRWIWIALITLAALVVLAAIALPMFLDPERYREHIERALNDATGWQAELGEIDLSVLRGLALTVSPAALSAPGEGSRVEIERIGVNAELLPLLGGELKIKSIDLVRPEILLVRKSQERGWELPRVLSEARETSADHAPPPARDAQGAVDGGAAGAEEDVETGIAVSIDRLRVRGGDLRMEDRSLDPPFVIGLQDVRLDLAPAVGDVDGGGELIDGGRLSWSGNIGDTITLELDEIPTDLFLPFVGADLLHPGGALSGTIEAALPRRIAGRLTGERILLLDGERPFDDLRTEFELLGDRESWRLERLQLDADGATVEGDGPLLPNLALRLRLTPTPLETALRLSEAVIPLPLNVEPPGSVQADLRVNRPEAGELTYEGNGELSAARFDIGETLPDASDVAAEFALDRNGGLEIRVVEGKVGGGPLRGTARIDSIAPPGTLSFDGGLQDAVLGELLGGLVHETVKRVAGPTSLDAGMTLDLSREVLDARSIGGRLELNSHDVNLPGWDLEGALRRGIEEQAASLTGVNELLQRHLGGSREDAPAEAAATSGAEALLDQLGASVDFDRMPWGLDRVEIGAGDINASGSGTFDPLKGEVNLRFTARLDAEKTAEMVSRTRELRALVGRDGRLAVPLEISGPLLRPSMSVDLGDLLSDQLEQEKDKAIEGLLKGLLDRD